MTLRRIAKSTRPVGSRPTAPLCAKLERGLLAYATAASAAGVGALALAQPVEAKIVYTPAHVVLVAYQHPAIYPLDLNRDGINDFSLVAGSAPFESGNFAYLACYPSAPSNMVWGRSFRSALRQGATIGPKGRFNRKFGRMGSVSYHSSPPRLPRLLGKLRQGRQRPVPRPQIRYQWQSSLRLGPAQRES